MGDPYLISAYLVVGITLAGYALRLRARRAALLRREETER